VSSNDEGIEYIYVVLYFPTSLLGCSPNVVQLLALLSHIWGGVSVNIYSDGGVCGFT